MFSVCQRQGVPSRSLSQFTWGNTENTCWNLEKQLVCFAPWQRTGTFLNVLGETPHCCVTSQTKNCNSIKLWTNSNETKLIKHPENVLFIHINFVSIQLISFHQNTLGPTFSSVFQTAYIHFLVKASKLPAYSHVCVLLTQNDVQEIGTYNREYRKNS